MEREIINPTMEQLCDLMCGKAEDDMINEYEIKIEASVIVSAQDIDDIITTALEGGITYWCGCAKVDGEYLGTWASEQVSRGGILKLYDDDEEEWLELTKDNFLIGLKLYLEKDNSILNGKEIDTCQVDADIADQIIQYAIFGEVIYG
jgi:hypothetical protein